MAERSILAYFNTPDQAHKALAQLKQLNLIDSRIDRFDGIPGDGIDQMMNPVRGEFDSLNELTQNGEFENRGAGVLSATSVSASGYSSGGIENRVTGRDILLTAIVGEQDYERARSIVQEAGAL